MLNAFQFGCNPVQVTDKGPYLELVNQTQSDIAAIKLGDAHWLCRYDEPVLMAGGMIREPANNGKTITGVAFEDGTFWGDPDVRTLKCMRDQMRAGGPVDLSGAQPVWFRTLLLYHRARHPGVQMETYGSFDSPTTF
jgi:hypothetical protein